MRDEMFHRDYDQGRDDLHAGIDRLIAKIGAVFRSIERVQFNAPWKTTLTR
ncbi:MAG TPA: hypothetical protein VFO42_03585 [Sphingomicrobium sp.]|nr:hypothetical protein [Sphingomicrobium sp.]